MENMRKYQEDFSDIYDIRLLKILNSVRLKIPYGLTGQIMLHYVNRFLLQVLDL